jgi:Leucine-rich repeat (LRR) protein
VIIVFACVSLSYETGEVFNIEHNLWTAYFEVPENVTITEPGTTIANPVSEDTKNLIIEDYEERMEYLPENIDEIFPNLLNFWIFECFMKSISKSNLKNLSLLQYLSISMNEYLEKIEENSLEDLIELKDLYLQSNSLSKLHPLTFAKLEKLEILDLSANQLTSLDVNLFQNNKRLEYLLMSGNKLMTIVHGTFDSLKNLKKLWLNDNEITHLPSNVLQHNQNLNQLQLHENDISSIDKHLMANLTKLKEVSFAGNMLIAVDFEIIEQNEKLFEISFSENKISKLENIQVIRNILNLHEINLKNNSCIDRVFFGVSGEIVHSKMSNEVEESCAALELDSVTLSVN